MLMSGLAALVVDAFVRRKPMIRVWFNVAQYMLAVGVGGLAYRAAGGVGGPQDIYFWFVSFFSLVVTFFLVKPRSVGFWGAALLEIAILGSFFKIAGGA